MKEVYILATTQETAVDEAAIAEAFDAEDVEVVFGENDALFSVKSEASRVDVRFEARAEDLGWSPDLLSGSEASHKVLQSSRGFYRVSFTPGEPQPTVAVFEALWAVRTMLELVEGVVLDVTAFKLHSVEDIEEITELDFDIRDHISLHAVEVGKGDTPLWIHSHGMTKFGLLDVEVFNLAEPDLKAAEIFFHELCTDLAFGQAPPARTPVTTSVGTAFMMMPSIEARQLLRLVPQDTFNGHEQEFMSVVSHEGRHTVSELLGQYRERFEAETDEESTALQGMATELLPAFKARFQRKGFMEPSTFLIRAPFEVHPQGEKAEPEDEKLWVEVITWEEDTIVGKLIDGGQSTTEWRKGAHVEIDESQVNAIGMSREGRQLEHDEMKSLLTAERPM